MLSKRVAQSTCRPQARLFSILGKDDLRGVSELALVVRGGSRYEPAPGVAHALDKFAFRDTAKCSALRLTRESEMLGGTFQSYHDREKLVLHTKFLKHDLPYYVNALANVAKQTLFMRHEMDEVVFPQLQAESKAALADSAVAAVELLHETAFHRGLGNPVYAVPGQAISLEDVRSFASKVFNKSNISLYGQGVIESDLQKLAEEAFKDLSEGSPVKPEKLTFYRGEARLKSAHLVQSVAIAFPVKPDASFNALANALVSVPVKWSTGTGLLNALPDVQVSVTPYQYEDAGLFTVLLQSPSSAVLSSAAKETVRILKKVAGGELPKDACTRAIAKAKFQAAEAQTKFLPGVTVQDASALSQDSVKKSAAKLVEGRPVLAVVGRTMELPYYDELFE